MAHSCDRIVRTLRELGVSVDVAHFSARYANWRVEAKRNGRHIFCPVREDPTHAMNRLWNTLAGEANLTDAYTHVVAFGGLLPMLCAPVYAAWLRLPLVTMIRGNDFDAGIFSLKRGDVLREALSRSAHVCAVSHDKVEKISALYPRTPVSWTPNGIDLTDWQFAQNDLEHAAEWRQATVEKGRRVLGFFGQLKRKKGGLFFLEALLRSGEADRFHLLFIGDAEPEMLEWLEAHQPEVAFTRLPFLDHYDLLPFYAACEMVVIPSFYDGLPNVLLEAAGLGIPALASTAGGMADFLRDDEHAILFRPGDPHECRRAISRAAEMSDEELRRLGENSRALARSAFDHRVEAGRHLAVLKETRRAI
jgi:glycogen synthase